MNADKVCFGRLKVQISLELVSRQSFSKRPGETGGEPVEPPRFVVGPGATTWPTAKRRYADTLGAPQKDKDIDTVISCLKEGDTGGMERGKETPVAPHGTSERAVGERVPTVTSRTEDHLGGGVGSQQLEVISELLERGKKLRDAMLHSMLEPSTAVAASHTVPSQPTRPEDLTR